MKKILRYSFTLVVIGVSAWSASANDTSANGQVEAEAQGAAQGAGRPQASAGNTNESVSRQWSQTTAGVEPALVQQEDGATRIEWHGGVSVESYTNSIDTQNSFGSALRSGNHGLMRLQSDLRGITAGQDINYFQLGITATGDRAVLSQYPRQIDTLQVGRAGAGYIVSLGDVTPNFSSLSSALGVRGFLGQRQIDRATVSVYAGVVAPSWEYLDRDIPRLQLMKEVQGAKVDYALGNDIRVYVTGQHGHDVADSADVVTPTPADLHSATLGIQLTGTNYAIAAETAFSRYQQTGEESLNGAATIVDGTWRSDTLLLRAGYHDLNAKFISLSQAVRPGTREAYTGGDWQAASWISVGADLRTGRTYTLPTVLMPSELLDTDSGSLRANINFGADHTNWTLALQSSTSNSHGSPGRDSSNDQNSINLNYARNQWTASAGYALGRMQNAAQPTMDGDTDTLTASVGRTFSDQTAVSPGIWLINTALSTSVQDQHLAFGLETKAFSTSLNISGQHTDWGMLNIVLGTGSNTRPNGQSTLRMTSIQIDGSRPLGKQGSIKLYARDTRRNLNDVALYADERVTGVQLGYRF